MQIVSDSTCNLSDKILRTYDIKIAPISIQFNNISYEENITIDRDLFYQKIEEMGIIPTTSQPSPSWFAKFYQEAAAKNEPVLVVTVTGKHSGTYNSAKLAASMVPGADVTVFDSLSLSFGTGLMTLEAARMAQNGKSMTEILQHLEHIRSQGKLVMTPSTLKYLRMSGRVGAIKSAVASMLQLLPILKVVDGVLALSENVRTRKKALDRLIQILVQELGSDTPVNLAIMDARCPEDAKLILESARARLNCQEIITGELVASLAVHGGPGVIGMFAYPINK